MAYGNGTPRGYSAVALQGDLAIPMPRGEHDLFLWVILADTGANTAEVEVAGEDGIRTYQLDKAGDVLRLPMYGVSVATVRASAYPTTVGWFLLPATGSVSTGLTRTT